MKEFLETSGPLWKITRAIVILAIGYDIMKEMFANGKLDLFVIGIRAVAVAYVVALVIVLYHELRSYKLPFLTRSFAGGVSVLFAFTIIIEVVAGGHKAWLIVVPWLVLFGLYDIMNINAGPDPEDEDRY